MKVRDLFERLWIVSFAFYCGTVSVGSASSVPGYISLGVLAVSFLGCLICSKINK